MALNGEHRDDGAPRVETEYGHDQLRLKNCLETVAQVHDFLAGESVSDQLLAQFERLQEVMHSLENVTVTGQDVDKIEAATNRLLDELKVLFHHRDLGQINPGIKH
jgi:cell division FtsZ-interacting protein ZapD